MLPKGGVFLSSLKRFGVSIDEELLERFDKINKRVYNNRSEAIRDLIREKIIEEENKTDESIVVGTLTLIYDHHKSGLTDKMNQLQHDYHCMFKTNLHIHLNHDYCLEVIVVEGKMKKLNEVTRRLIALKGVKHGELTVANIKDVEDREYDKERYW